MTHGIIQKDAMVEQRLLNDPSSNPKQGGGVGTAEAFIIFKSYMKEYEAAKDAYNKSKTKDNQKSMLQSEKNVSKWLNIVRKRGTSAGRAVQTFSKFDATTPEGVLLKAQREIDSATDKMKKRDPKN